MLVICASVEPARIYNRSQEQCQPALGNRRSVMGCLLLLMHLFLVPTSGESDSLCRLRGRFDLPHIAKDGDIVVGGSFNIHYYREEQTLDFRSAPEPPVCKSFDFSQFQFAQTMIYTIEEINRNQTLLPNITLGYQIHDGCGDPAMSTKVTTLLISGQEETLADPKCKTTANIPTIVTDAESMQSVAVARVITPFNVTMFSYSSAYDYLNNMYEFPTFFRTIPNDYHQVDGLAQLVKYFGWNWIGTIRSNSTYGALAMDEITKSMQSFGICIAFSVAVHKTDSKAKLQSLINTIKQASTKIVVAFVAQADMAVLLREIVRQNVTGIQWIGSESWITMPSLSPEEAARFLAGTVGFAVPRTTLPGLKEFLLQVHPSQYPGNAFVTEFWETTFECFFEKPENYSSSDGGAPAKLCTGEENLEEVDNQYTDVSQLRIAYNVYKAVYAIAHSLNNMLVKTNFTFSSLDLWELLHYMYAVNFTAKNGEYVYFDENLDTVPLYELVNWQIDSEGLAHVVTIGQYDGLVQFEKRLSINKEDIVWIDGKKEVPRGVCSDSCLPGTWKTVKKEMPLCCFSCIPCTDGEISNVTGAVSCLKCPPEYWSNEPKTQCVPKKVEFLSFDDEMGCSLVVLAVIGAFLTVMTALIFYKHKETPLVKANNSELSFLLLLALTLCFLCSLTFIDRPSTWSCMLRHTIFSISFVLCLSCILGKTIVVLMAFKTRLPNNKKLKWFSRVHQRLNVFGLTSVQTIICIMWLTTAPPIPINSTKYYKAIIILECNVGSMVYFCCVFSYIGALALLCCALAFFARKLPDNFNEATFITFSMLIFCAVWITFIPAYVSSPGKYSVAVEVFAILASSFGLLFCIFAPKCYIILLQPEKNTKKYLMQRSKGKNN
ncbi:extracellular calcium-sensing receptor-like [Hypanus sabinus]|uniref:extracellular calcium-sensing receptor-like n=1 Tax=Hypanus sabinus TaxID=79690 RepID=UPI0028C376F6|nr:extracellular calcium-sensing receptor-like [Hypanus sabinus]